MAPSSNGDKPVSLVACHAQLIARIPATVTPAYRNILIKTIEKEVDNADTEDCSLKWTVQAAYHSNTEPASHEVVALSLCFDSGALEGGALEHQRKFYASHPGLAHHMHDWTIQGLVDKHNEKVRAFDIGPAAAGAAATSARVLDGAGDDYRAPRGEKRKASGFEGFSSGLAGKRRDLDAHKESTYTENKDTPRLNNLVKNRLKAKNPPTGTFPVLARTLPYADLSRTASVLPPSRFRSLTANGGTGLFPEARVPPFTPVGLGSSILGRGTGNENDNRSSNNGKDTIATLIAAAAAANPINTRTETETETVAAVAKLSAEIEEHHKKAADRIAHAKTLREERRTLAREQPISEATTIQGVRAFVLKSHELEDRAVKHQEDAIRHLGEAARLQGERALVAVEGLERRYAKVERFISGIGGLAKREREGLLGYYASHC